MDAGLVAVLAVLAVVLLVPLAFAWVSTNPRRWGRVERVLGRTSPPATIGCPVGCQPWGSVRACCI